MDTAVSQEVIFESVQERSDSNVLKLRLDKKEEKKVKWTNETVDNEDLGKKKSKCCCIYNKPKAFDESSDEDEGECRNCYGHRPIVNK